jgi:hypothetical protein
LRNKDNDVNQKQEKIPKKYLKIIDQYLEVGVGTKNFCCVKDRIAQ